MGIYVQDIKMENSCIYRMEMTIGKRGSIMINETQWSGRELKERSKLVLRQYYWRIILVAMFLTILIDYDQMPTNAVDHLVQEQAGSVMEGLDNGFSGISIGPFGLWGAQENIISGISTMTAFFLFVVTSLGGVLVITFLTNPFQVGCFRFFNRSFDTKPQFKEVFYAFENRYKNIVSAMFLRDLFTFLWMFAFIVPGIVKAYEYKMVPYLLAEHPDMQPKEVLEASKQLMRGQKGKAFLLDLSFVGWLLLSGMTFGILGIFFVTPYMRLTGVALYRKLLGGDMIPHNIYYEGMEEESNETGWHY